MPYLIYVCNAHIASELTMVLVEREGTNCENLQETHEFLKIMRKFIDDNYPGNSFFLQHNLVFIFVQAALY